MKIDRPFIFFTTDPAVMLREPTPVPPPTSVEAAEAEIVARLLDEAGCQGEAIAIWGPVEKGEYGMGGVNTDAARLNDSCREEQTLEASAALSVCVGWVGGAMNKSVGHWAAPVHSAWVSWLIWVAATCAGVLVMTLLRIGARVLPVQGVFILLLLVAQPVGVFLLSGGAQHFALRFILPSARGWFPRTLLGTIVGLPLGLALAFLVAWLLSLWLRLQRARMTGPPMDLSVGGLFAAMGMAMLLSVVASIAMAQWRVLRRRCRRAGWWPAISAFSWIAGFFTAGKLMFPRQELMEAFFRYLFIDERGKAEWPGIATTVAAGLVMGLLVGGITGAALIYILRAGPPAAAKDAERPPAG